MKEELLDKLWYHEHINLYAKFSFQESLHEKHFYYEDLDITVILDDSILYFYKWCVFEVWNSVRRWMKWEMSIVDSRYMFCIRTVTPDVEGILKLINLCKNMNIYFHSEAVWLTAKIQFLSTIRPNASGNDILYDCIDIRDKNLVNYNTYLSWKCAFNLALEKGFKDNYYVNLYLSPYSSSWLILKMRINHMWEAKVNELNTIIKEYFDEWFDLFNMKYKNY